MQRQIAAGKDLKNVRGEEADKLIHDPNVGR